MVLWAELTFSLKHPAHLTLLTLYLEQTFLTKNLRQNPKIFLTFLYNFRIYDPKKKESLHSLTHHHHSLPLKSLQPQQKKKKGLYQIKITSKINKIKTNAVCYSSLFIKSLKNHRNKINHQHLKKIKYPSTIKTILLSKTTPEPEKPKAPLATRPLLHRIKIKTYFLGTNESLYRTSFNDSTP